MNQVTKMIKKVLEPPTVPVSGELRYMPHLWVSANAGHHQSDSSQSVTIGSELLSSDYQYKIKAAIKRTPFREEHVLVQFWSPRVVGKHVLLTTIVQPFGVGVPNEQLCFYRRYSEHDGFLVNKVHEEDELSPVARVFRQGLPEWTCDVANYNTKDFPQQECAIRCNLHGYLALPVFDPTTRLCVGVLELLTSFKLEDFAYEVKHIHDELKMENLTSPKAYDGPVSNVFNKYELDKIFDVLKDVCDTHNLPLALTWTLSPSATYVVHEKVIQKSCCSFNTRCFNKVCMSTALPFYVGDMSAWSFIKPSKECHLEKSRGVAGRAMSSGGSCFCGDVTKLDEEDYPLVHNARMSGLTVCFAIFLHSVEGNHDYVLEFFLKDSRHVVNVVQTLQQSFVAASGFELGDGSKIDVVGSPMDLSVNETDLSDSESIDSSDLESIDSSDSESIDSSDSESIDSSDSESIEAEIFEPDYANVADQWPSTNDSIEETCDNFTI